MRAEISSFCFLLGTFLPESLLFLSYSACFHSRGLSAWGLPGRRTRLAGKFLSSQPERPRPFRLRPVCAGCSWKQRRDCHWQLSLSNRASTIAGEHLWPLWAFPVHQQPYWILRPASQQFRSCPRALAARSRCGFGETETDTAAHAVFPDSVPNSPGSQGRHPLRSS